MFAALLTSLFCGPAINHRLKCVGSGFSLRRRPFAAASVFPGNKCAALEVKNNTVLCAFCRHLMPIYAQFRRNWCFAVDFFSIFSLMKRTFHRTEKPEEIAQS